MDPCSTGMKAALSGPGITIVGCSYRCTALGSGTWTEDSMLFGDKLTSGMLLTTGKATDAKGPNTSPSTTYSGDTLGDTDLQGLVGSSPSVTDVCTVSIDFKTVGSITWSYSFASEEYEEYVNSQYNDVFGFFFSGPGVTKSNLAKIPGTTLPVSINNVNHLSNTAYYRTNMGNQHPQIQYDGYTFGLSVDIKGLNPDLTYTVKLAIGDVADSGWDSGVFVSTLAVSDPFIGVTPNDVTVECDAVPIKPTPVTTKFCTTPTITYTEVTTAGTCINKYTITRKWVATDACGSTVSATQTVHVQDTHAPVFHGVPSDITIECDKPVPAAPTVTATDNCDTSTLNVIFSQSTVEGCSKTITRTWTVTDSCGNTATAKQIIHVQDTTKPVLVGVPSDITIECDKAVPAAPTVTATDNCDGSPAIEYTQNLTPGTCSNSYKLTRTWVATDSCGNKVSATQTITVKDTTKPVITGVPEGDFTVECDSVPTEPKDVFATDSCNNYPPKVYYSEDYANEVCANTYTIIRTWKATDDCGNVATVSQNVHVQDTKTPVLNGVPSDITVEIDNIPTILPTVTAIDSCDLSLPVVTETETTTKGDCLDSYTITRTWTSTDDCGNKVSASQNIYVQDTIKPVLIGVPSDTTAECDSIPEPPVVTATDNSGSSPTVEYKHTESTGDCPNTYTITRTWKATDDCGNTASASQKIYVQDTKPPVLIGVPCEETVECDSIPEPPEVTASDNCDGSPTVVYKEDITNGHCENKYTITRTWTSTDDCGNTVSASQTIYVQDTKPPVLIGVPAEETVECDSIPEPPEVTSTDNCNGSPLVYYEQNREDGGCANTYTLTRTWTSTDDCGNTVSASQIIHVQDTTQPILYEVPSDITVECDSIPEPENVYATDNCGGTPEVEYTFEKTNIVCSNKYTITRTWKAKDKCGNEVSAHQTIYVQDTTKPVLIGVPSDTTVECDGVPEPPEVTSTDNCNGSPTVEYKETKTNGYCANTYTITRTWTAVDDCGNAETATQTISVVDIHAPVLDGVPSEVKTVEYDNIPTVPTVTATDNCDFYPVDIYTETRTNVECPNKYTLTRTWKSTDCCQNSDSQSQTIIVVDTQPPIFHGVPADVTVEIDKIPKAATVTATDDSDIYSDPQVTYKEDKIGGLCPNNYSLIRTWTATDSCGNTGSRTQTVHVQDTTPPVLKGVPADVTKQCAFDVPIPADVTATDNSGDIIKVTLSIVQTPGTCSNRFELRRTWTGTDSCGNVATASQLITIFDNTAPIVAVQTEMKNVCIWPDNHSFWCASPTALWSFSDNCKGNVSTVLKYCNSSECDEAPCPGLNGDGNFPDDCKVVNNQICFRSERAGSTVDKKIHRYYFASEKFTDECGNLAEAGVSVTVPHDQQTIPCVCYKSPNYNPKGRN